MTRPVEDNQEGIIKEAVRKFVDARWQDQEPDIDEFVEQYPGLERQIRQGIRDAQRIDALFDSLVQADDSDFENSATEHDLVGHKLASFDVERVIGRGGMGVVYLAHDTKLDRHVAIKSMPGELLSSPIAQVRFRREAKLLASLNHPNIAAIYDIVEQDEGAGHLILEYIPGETLTERIAREPLKLEEALSIGRQIAEAVSAAHEKGVVHRDLKPGNAKITPDGRVKVLDFGLAKASVSEGTGGKITETQPGHIIGTPAYMSPEQARGRATDHRTDIWSFGCIMYQMLTGNLPFEGETATDTLARIIEREPDWKMLPQETPTNVRVLLRRCLEKDPDRRLGDIADARTEISEVLRGSSTEPSLQVKLRRTTMIVGAAIIIVLSGVVAWFALNKQAQPSSSKIRLVVLPFENLGPAEDEYFADGISEEIMSRLSAFHTLGVISRTSTIQYKNVDKTIQQIEEELGVEYVLIGTVRWDRPPDGPSRVRVTPQLIRVSDDTQLWSKSYDAVLADIWQVQSDLAEQVAKELDITLHGPARRALASRPTEDVDAWDYYLRGNEYFHRSYDENVFEIAIGMYEKAVEMDPNFALAYARLSIVHGHMYWFKHDHSESRLAKAEKAVGTAFGLNPGLPEVHLALGWYYYHCHRNYKRALKHFAIARKSQPDHSFLLEGIAAVQRRLGDFEEALKTYNKAIELNPLDNRLAIELGYTYLLSREYQDAERCYNRAIELAPDLSGPYSAKAYLYLSWKGNTQEARTLVEKALENMTLAEERASMVDLLVTLDVYDENYEEALTRLTSKSEEDDDGRGNFIPNALRYAQIYGYTPQNKTAKEYYGKAREILISKIEEDPNDARFHSSLGIAYAGLGLDEAAIWEGREGVRLLEVADDAVIGVNRIEDLARIYMMVGKYDVAIEKLKFLLERPGGLSVSLLNLDPTWDNLCGRPDFEQLIESNR